MSVFKTMTVTCPSCGDRIALDAVFSVNADRRPDLREAILDGSFQSQKCERCRTDFRLAPELNYLDVGRGQWIAVWPVARLGDWQELEEQSDTTFQHAYGSEATGMAKDIGDGLDARLTFGWWGFREKLVAKEAGLDDTVLELMKVAVMRSLDDMPFTDEIELRLLEIEGQDLILAWINTQNEEITERIRVPREVYDDIAENQEDWQAIQGPLTAGMFVDMQRLMIGE